MLRLKCHSKLKLLGFSRKNLQIIWNILGYFVCLNFKFLSNIFTTSFAISRDKTWVVIILHRAMHLCERLKNWSYKETMKRAVSPQLTTKVWSRANGWLIFVNCSTTMNWIGTLSSIHCPYIRFHYITKNLFIIRWMSATQYGFMGLFITRTKSRKQWTSSSW